jgi:hypothetical protein
MEIYWYLKPQRMQGSEDHTKAYQMNLAYQPELQL